MPSVALAFYKTPSQAAVLGTTITKTVSIAQAEATIIRNYYQALESGATTSMAALAGAVAAVLTRNCQIALQVTAGVAATLISSNLVQTYFGQMANMFDAIDNDSTLKYVATYTYIRHGSNDGAYWLTDMTMKVNY